MVCNADSHPNGMNTTPILTYAFSPVITYDTDARWPLDSVVLFMIYAAEDAFDHLSSHYADIEHWVRSGRVGQKPTLPSYE